MLKIYNEIIDCHVYMYVYVPLRVNYTAVYSGTPLNGHPSTADAHDISDNSESPAHFSIDFNTLRIAGTSLLRIADAFRAPNCSQLFQQDCPPLLLELTT